MGGGLLQLVAYGAQDVYLTGNPQITFFKVIYRRYTNFSIESIEQTFNGSADFGKRVTCTISRNGDLIHRVYLQTDIPKLGGSGVWAKWLGLVLIRNVTVEIGGQQIDKHYGEWMYIWNELSLPTSRQAGYARLVGGPTTTVASEGSATVNADAPTTLYIPLEFWFCKNPGLALPLIALQYHEVKINIEFRSASDAVTVAGSSTPVLGNTSLWVDYIFLDTDERRRFAQLSHEYLIEQLQFTGEESVSGINQKIKLNFNHPVKELVWTVQNDNNVTLKDWFNFEAATDLGGGSNLDLQNPVATALLQLNGHDRFSVRPGEYFSVVQPFQHHTAVPADSQGINVYSFGLKPEEHQPSGTINMSRIDTAVLALTLKTNALPTAYPTGKVRVFAVNYNVLRIMSGMGGLAYSN